MNLTINTWTLHVGYTRELIHNRPFQLQRLEAGQFVVGRDWIFEDRGLWTEQKRDDCFFADDDVVRNSRVHRTGSADGDVLHAVRGLVESRHLHLRDARR